MCLSHRKSLEICTPRYCTVSTCFSFWPWGACGYDTVFCFLVMLMSSQSSRFVPRQITCPGPLETLWHLAHSSQLDSTWCRLQTTALLNLTHQQSNIIDTELNWTERGTDPTQILVVHRRLLECCQNMIHQPILIVSDCWGNLLDKC